MKDVIYLLFDLLTTLAKLLRPSGSRTVIAENLLLKQQLIIHSRSRQRTPNLTTQDRTILGFLSLFLNPRRITRAAIILKPSTVLSFYNALKKWKYRQLYSPRGGRKLGPGGPSKEVIPDEAGQALGAIVSMKQHNPRYGCPRIAQQINLAFGLGLDSAEKSLGDGHYGSVHTQDYWLCSPCWKCRWSNALPYVQRCHFWSGLATAY